MTKHKKEASTTQKPQEINLLNIIIFVAAVVLNIALAFWCFRIRSVSVSRSDGLQMLAVLFLFHYPICLFCDIYAGLHIRDSWYLPIVSPLTLYIFEPILGFGMSSPMFFLQGLGVQIIIMLVVAGIKALSEKKKTKEEQEMNMTKQEAKQKNQNPQEINLLTIVVVLNLAVVGGKKLSSVARQKARKKQS